MKIFFVLFADQKLILIYTNRTWANDNHENIMVMAYTCNSIASDINLFIWCGIGYIAYVSYV